MIFTRQSCAHLIFSFENKQYAMLLNIDFYQHCLKQEIYVLYGMSRLLIFETKDNRNYISQKKSILR